MTLSSCATDCAFVENVKLRTTDNAKIMTQHRDVPVIQFSYLQLTHPDTPDPL